MVSFLPLCGILIPIKFYWRWKLNTQCAHFRWAEAECCRLHIPTSGENQRAALGRALSLVRFPLMTVEEFASGAAQSGILTDRETVELFLYFTINPKPSIGFLDIPRSCMSGKEITISRFSQVESRWGYSGTSDRIRYDYYSYTSWLKIFYLLLFIIIRPVVCWNCSINISKSVVSFGCMYHVYRLLHNVWVPGFILTEEYLLLVLVCMGQYMALLSMMLHCNLYRQPPIPSLVQIRQLYYGMVWITLSELCSRMLLKFNPMSATPYQPHWRYINILLCSLSMIKYFFPRN